MKYLKFLLFICFVGILHSCGGDDDICDSGEGTPRLKVKFRVNNKSARLDSLKVFADLGSGIIDFGWSRNVDSVFVPLKVDESPYTDIFFKTSTQGDSSKVRISYTTRSIYVSPGCGVKKNYDNVNAQLLLPNPVLKVESGQNSIENEDKTNLFLSF